MGFFSANQSRGDAMHSGLPSDGSHVSTLSEAELLARVREGDRAAFDHLMHQHTAILVRIAYGYVKSGSDAEDIVQDVFLAVWRARTSWHPQGPVARYLAVAVRRRALNILKHRRVETTYAERVTAHAEPSDDAVPSADAEALARDDRATLRRLVAALPERSRLAILLRYGQQRSVADVAEILGISALAARQLVWRALDQLRKGYRG